jgi:hypothetical protein
LGVSSLQLPRSRPKAASDFHGVVVIAMALPQFSEISVRSTSALPAKNLQKNVWEGFFPFECGILPGGVFMEFSG